MISLVPLAAPASNYVRLSDSGRYFQLEDGTDFLPIGHNEGVDWPFLERIYPFHAGYDPVQTREYFNMLHDHGVNVIRIMTEAPASALKPGGIQMENPVGAFDPDTVLFLDHLFELAADYRIYLMITPYDTFWMNKTWNDSPYNPERGGPVHDPHDFLTSDACFEYQQARWKFLIDRYGNSDYVFAWDLLNELDIWWDSSEEEELAWVDRMTSFLQHYERQRWGKNHLVCISTAASNPSTGGALNFAVYRHPNVDFPTTHMYYPDVSDPPDAIAPALAVHAGTKFQIAQIPTGDPRPYLDSESGPIDDWPQPRALDDEIFHNMTWAHLAAGGAGGGLRWPYRNDPHSLTDTMHDYQLAMSRIARNIRWSSFASADIDDDLTLRNTVGHTLIPMGCGDGATALVWILQDSRSSSGTVPAAVLDVAGMQPGSYLARFFDSYTGDLLDESHPTADSGTVSVALPAFDRDIVVILRSEEPDPGPPPRKPVAYITSPAPGSGTGSASKITVSADVEAAPGAEAVFFAACDDGAGTGVQLLPNASFETATLGGPSDWSPYLWEGSPVFEWAVENHTGSRSLRISSDGGADASWWTTVRVAPHAAYRLSGWIRTENVLTLGGLGAFLNVQGIGGTTSPVLTGTHDWTYVQLDFNSGSRSVVQVNGTLGGWGRVRGTAWFDDLSLEPLSAVKTWRRIGVDASFPYAIDWDISGIPDQAVDFAVGLTAGTNHTIRSVREIHGVVLERNSGDRTSPFGSIVVPGLGSEIPAGPVPLKGHAWDRSSGVDRVQFWIQGTPSDPNAAVNTLLGEVHAAPYELDVDLAPYAGTTRWISMDVFDRSGNSLRPADLHSGVAVGNDVLPPSGRILQPAVGDLVTSIPVTLEARAADIGSGVDFVRFYAYYDGAWHFAGEDDSPPFSVSWYRVLAPQRIAFTVDVFDHAGNAAAPADSVSGLWYQVEGDTVAPWCHFVVPDSYTTIDLPCTLEAIAGDENSGVAAVTFRYLRDGEWHTIGQVEIAPYALSWEGTGLPDGTVVTLGVDVADHAGNINTLADSRIRLTLRRSSVGSTLATY